MTLELAPATLQPRFHAPPSFRYWQHEALRRGTLPVVAVAGSRGKSTVVRIVDAIFNAAGLRTATWTNLGVEIRGRRQRGELAPWTRALGRLAEGSLDVAIQELDWSTVHAVGLPSSIYPVVAVTNICVNSDTCLVQDETRRAMQAYPRIAAAVRTDGALILNGEDYAVSGEEIGHRAPVVLVAHSKDRPLVRTHLREGGTAAWLNEDRLHFGRDADAVSLCAATDLDFALRGAAAFQLLNAMTAASIAQACGLDARTVSEAVASYETSTTLMPGSFNLWDVAGATVVVDRPAPSWFLRPVLRAANQGAHRRQITVVGALETVPDSDIQEVGRLLGRSHGAIIVHSEDRSQQRAELFRRGVAMNDVPPLIVHVPTERQAINRALKLVRPENVLLVLADDAAAVVRAMNRAQESHA